MQALANRIKHRFNRALGQPSFASQPPAPAVESFAPGQIDIYETTPLRARSSDILKPRLNLLVPALAKEHMFGGITTALHVFLALTGDDHDVRIVLSDQAHYPCIDLDLLADWSIVSADDVDRHGRLIVPFADRGSRTLTVRRHDIFVATAWWTAYVLQRLTGWQANFYQQTRRPLVYLIQDHEPGFYPWSTRYSLAQSTYQFDGPMVGIFNTRLLYDYFLQQGYCFASAYSFEPQLNSVLYRHRQALTQVSKQRQLIVYGRPGVARNAFELVYQAIRQWTELDPQAQYWTILSIGEKHPDISLPNNCRIQSLGKLTLDQYAAILQQSAIGLSLMFSPHPSYPPLEMAEFGIQTITNTFANKNLSHLSQFIHSLDNPTPENIAALIHHFADMYREQATQTVALPSKSIFAPPGKVYQFVGELRTALQLTT